jgi:alpha-N-arabinofuranosidase
LGLIDHFSIHRYWIHGGPELNFTEQQYYDLLAEATATEDFITLTHGHLKEALGTSTRRIGIALDEWGVWHPEARSWGPDPDPRDPVTYEQAGTLRDALAVGVALEGFHRQANVLSLANLAQIVNVLHAPVMTDGAAMWLTPTYYALQMHKPHLGAAALPVEVTHGGSVPGGSSAVTGTASSGNGTTVTLVNRHYTDGATVSLNVPANRVVGAVLLAADDPRAQNSAQQPENVKPVSLNVGGSAGQWKIELPAHSMATIQFA